MTKRDRLILLIGCALLAGLPLTARADVTVQGESPPVVTLITGVIVDDPDPVGPVWEPVGPVTPGTLQGNGGRPDVALTPGTAAPLVVWAEETGIDHDIAFSRWTGSGWSAVEYLTSSLANELDPRIFRDPDGTVHVVWWRHGTTPETYLSSRPSGQGWSTPVAVSAPGEVARRPSVATVDGETWVAYERDSTTPGMAQDVVVARLGGNGQWTREIVVSTVRADPLDAVLHSRLGHVWLDWKHRDDEFGCLEYGPAGWSAPELEPWIDRTWIGVEEMRKILQRHIMDP